METAVETKVVSAIDTTTTILTEDSANTLNKMLGSKDPADHLVARQILNQLDVEKSIYWIWQLAKNHNTRMVYLRTKASREFNTKAQVFTISYKKSLEFAEWLNNKKWLTHDIYQALKDDINKTMKDKLKNVFFDSHITIKDYYKELDPNNEIINLSKL